jgi:hypothetical protein
MFCHRKPFVIKYKKMKGGGSGVLRIWVAIQLSFYVSKIYPFSSYTGI